MILALFTLILNISPANAIIGGVPVTADDPIAHSTVMLIGETATGMFSCSGTILNDEWVLTAAHCSIGVKDMVVVFSTHAPDTSWARLLSSGLHYRRVVDLNHNQDYPDTNIGQMIPHNDIGLVRFSGGLPKGYYPVTILNPSVDAKYLTPNTPVVIAGFGKRGADPKTDDSGNLYKDTVPLHRIVGQVDANVGSDGSVACHGDSGGPAFIQVNGKYYQWGVASLSDCIRNSVYIPLKSNFYGQMATPE